MYLLFEYNLNARHIFQWFLQITNYIRLNVKVQFLLKFFFEMMLFSVNKHECCIKLVGHICHIVRCIPRFIVHLRKNK